MTTNRFSSPEDFALFKARVINEYQPLGSVDKRIDEGLATIIKNTKNFEFGAATSQRFLFVTGPSGSGKSYTLQHKFALIPEFQPFTDASGKPKRPFISYRAPKQFNPKEMLIKIAQHLNVPAGGSENHLRDVLDQQIPFHGLKYIHIDEAQHGIRANATTTILAFQDALKAITSMDHWPLHIILSGMPNLDDFRVDDDQIARRSEAVKFHPLEDPVDLEVVNAAVELVVSEQCGLVLDPDVDLDDLAARLIEACNGAFGYVIEALQDACFLAMENGRSKVQMDHFAHNYRRKSACRPKENLYSVDAPFWRAIQRKKPTNGRKGAL